MLVTEDTKRIAQQALDYLTAHPERHNQESWWDGEPVSKSPIIFRPIDEGNLCNTTMCVAGTVQFQQKGYVDPIDVREYATQALGLDNIEAQLLFMYANEEDSLDLLRAIANGDDEKFAELRISLEEIYYEPGPE